VEDKSLALFDLFPRSLGIAGTCADVQAKEQHLAVYPI
jgi:hypothetical protein